MKFECRFSSTSLGVHGDGTIGQIDIHLVKSFPIMNNFAEVLVTNWYFEIGFVQIRFTTWFHTERRLLRQMPAIDADDVELGGSFVSILDKKVENLPGARHSHIIPPC
jgi:hypothetical protein